MGESDPGAVVGGNGTNTVDAVGGFRLTNTPPAGPFCRYTNGVGTVAKVISPLALALTNNQYCTGALVTNLTDNFGIECWVRPATAAGGGAVLAYNGLRGNGWGLYLSGTNYQALFGGVLFFGSAPTAVGTWTHVALVRDNGLATLFTNGVPAATALTPPLTPTTSFTVGGNALFGEFFPGTIDEVRVFSFVPGAFNTNDLLCFAAPSVTTLLPSEVVNTDGILNGTVNPGGLATSAWFEWGSSPFTNSTITPPVAIGNGATFVSVTNLLSGFAAGQTYYYRTVASNASGTVRGKAVAFGAPTLGLNGAAAVTNECSTAWVDPGVGVSGAPLAIASGFNHNLALKSDGTVVGWGRNLEGQTTVPPGLSNVVAIVAGHYHSLALRSNGTVLGWGNNTFGQTNIPPGLSNVVAIAAGYYHNLALKSDGTVVAWGDDTLGQRPVPVGLSNVVAISGGYAHSLALKGDGTVAAWGLNDFGEATVPANLSNVVAIAAGNYHSLALRSDGTVVAWGNPGNSQMVIPAGLSNVVAIAEGHAVCLALKSDGTVAAWGNNFGGQLALPAALTNVVAIAAGYTHCLALRSDGTIVAWGSGSSGQTNIPPDLSTLSLPITVTGNFNPNNGPGTYTRTYQAVNALGGSSAPASRTVVVRDTTPPVITVNGPNPIIFTNLNRIYTDPGATSLDACGGATAVNVNNPVNPNLGGTYTVTYTATDASGNTAISSRTVFVALPPAVAGDLDGDGLVSASELDVVYGNYVTNSPFLLMTNVAGLGGTNVTFALSNAPAGSFSVEYSTNLVNWFCLGPATPRYLFTDTNAPALPQRHYRLRWP